MQTTPEVPSLPRSRCPGSMVPGSAELTAVGRASERVKMVIDSSPATWLFSLWELGGQAQTWVPLGFLRQTPLSGWGLGVKGGKGWRGACCLSPQEGVGVRCQPGHSPSASSGGLRGLLVWEQRSLLTRTQRSVTPHRVCWGRKALLYKCSGGGEREGDGLQTCEQRWEQTQKPDSHPCWRCEVFP